jgi:hypothetical protein
MQLYVAGLEDGPDLDRKGLAALVALVRADTGALALQFATSVHDPAVWTYAAIRPNAGLYKLIGRLLIVEVFGRKDRHDNHLIPNVESG